MECDRTPACSGNPGSNAATTWGIPDRLSTVHVNGNAYDYHPWPWAQATEGRDQAKRPETTYPDTPGRLAP